MRWSDINKFERASKLPSHTASNSIIIRMSDKIWANILDYILLYYEMTTISCKYMERVDCVLNV